MSGEAFVYSISAIISLKSSAFMMATMAECQKTDALDMLMYYDARPSVWNGMFDYYTLKCLKGYYPIKWFGMFYDCEYEVRCENQPENIYTLCGVNKDGKILATVTNYTDDDDAEGKTVTLNFGREGNYEVYALDNKSDATLLKVTDNLKFDVPLFASLLIKEI